MSDTTRTKQLIKNVLIDLCQTQSFRKISVQKIANEAKINRQTFYYHFTDKYDFLRWVYCEDALHYLDPQCLTLDNWEEQALKMLKAIAEKKEFYGYGCSVLVNWITNEYEETPMEISMQLFRLAKDTELYSYRLYAKEELEEQ